MKTRMKKLISIVLVLTLGLAAEVAKADFTLGTPSCDIGPTPLGDGIVDVQDLIVLAEHLFEEIPPVEPVE